MSESPILDPPTSNDVKRKDVDEDDIEVWKDLHMSLTMAVLELEDSITMRKVQRRFILETIVRHVPPMDKNDSNDQDENNDNKLVPAEGVATNPANPNWLDDPLCGNDIFDPEKIAQIMKLQNSSRSARTTISSSVSHWVRNSNTSSAPNILKAADDFGSTSVSKSSNASKQKKNTTKKTSKPKASHSDDDIVRDTGVNDGYSSDERYYSKKRERANSNSNDDSSADEDEIVPKKKKKKKRTSRDDETSTKKPLKKKKKRSQDNSKSSSKAKSSSKKLKKKKKKKKKAKKRHVDDDDQPASDEQDDSVDGVDSPVKPKRKLTLKLKFGNDKGRANDEYTDSDDDNDDDNDDNDDDDNDDDDDDSLGFEENRESNNRGQWKEQERSASFDSYDDSSNNRNPYRRQSKSEKQFDYSIAEGDASGGEHMTDDIEKYPDQEEDFGF
uniref:Uncharacterized protein n=1 Tax=Corethron hystrix TaxID=216773 RepID=A0A7S1FNW6_9STRA|mmetsp:Transcript_19286/g.43924  ORF Transcript_19286/g.43924 Transcript_19286/m.43924 type:complete len:442 (+) Transcript_19286:284-1609(+)